MQSVDEIVQQGKVRQVGLSTLTFDEIKACVANRWIDVLQYGYNLFDWGMAKCIFPYVRESKIGLMACGLLSTISG